MMKTIICAFLVLSSFQAFAQSARSASNNSKGDMGPRGTTGGYKGDYKPQINMEVRNTNDTPKGEMGEMGKYWELEYSSIDNSFCAKVTSALNNLKLANDKLSDVIDIAEEEGNTDEIYSLMKRYEE